MKYTPKRRIFWHDMKRLFKLNFCLLLTVTFSGCITLFSFSYHGYPSRYDYAKHLIEEKKYDEAIVEYQLHIDERLNSPSRPTDENPFFYYILIGDVFLKKNDIQSALGAFKTAHENKVHDKLVLDRFRQVAEIYVLEKKFDNAIELLTTYREIDTLLVDSDIDKIHRTMIEVEEESKKENGTESISPVPSL